MPAATFVRQICPEAEYEVKGDFEETWASNGFFGFVMNYPPDLTGFVDLQIEKLEGDAAMDVMVETDLRMLIMAVLVRYHVRGTVIRYTNDECRAT